MSQLIVTGGFGDSGGTTGAYADIDWSKSKYNLTFNIKTNALNFTIRTFSKSFSLITHNELFDINSYNMIYEPQIFNLDFISKRCT